MKKYLSLFCLLIIVSLQLNAQEFKTDQPVSKQLKGDAQPGMRYAPAASTAPQVKPHTSMADGIRNGKFGRIKSGDGSVPVAKPASRTGSNVSLPSDQSAREAGEKQGSAPAMKIQPPPMQQVPATPVSGTKATSAGPVNTIPVKKAQQ